MTPHDPISATLSSRRLGRLAANRARATVVIVGGGFTGAAVAYNLACAGAAADIVVVEPRARLGGGLAYGGDDPCHRVNVPASRMSLLPDDEGHFARWLEAEHALDADPEARVGAEAFPRRREFGRYVEAQLAPHLASGAIRRSRGRAVGLAKSAARWRVATDGGAEIAADFVVLAVTHPAARVPSELEPWRGHPRLVVDALADRALRGVAPNDRVLIVGAGLTAADLAAALDAQGHRGAITMISRRGLRSRAHAATPLAPFGDFLDRPSREASDLLIAVRRAVREAAAAGIGWQAVFERLRMDGGEIWRALRPSARRRVARHLRPFWDAHRFRLAPQIEAVLERRLGQGSLRVRKARLGRVQASEAGFCVAFQGAPEPEAFEWIAVATGPAHGDILRDGFLRDLAARGALALDETGLGLKTSDAARAVGAGGEADPSLFVAGPLARGTFGELMGLPQVSRHARLVAEEIAAALACQTRRQAAVA